MPWWYILSYILYLVKDYSIMDIHKLVSLCGVEENFTTWKGHTFLAHRIEKIEFPQGFIKGAATCEEIIYAGGTLVKLRLVGVVLFIDYQNILVRMTL